MDTNRLRTDLKARLKNPQINLIKSKKQFLQFSLVFVSRTSPILQVGRAVNYPSPADRHLNADFCIG